VTAPLVDLAFNENNSFQVDVQVEQQEFKGT